MTPWLWLKPLHVLLALSLTGMVLSHPI